MPGSGRRPVPCMCLLRLVGVTRNASVSANIVGTDENFQCYILVISKRDSPALVQLFWCGEQPLGPFQGRRESHARLFRTRRWLNCLPWARFGEGRDLFRDNSIQSAVFYWSIDPSIINSFQKRSKKKNLFCPFHTTLATKVRKKGLLITSQNVNPHT